jgi:hypothetical protein
METQHTPGPWRWHGDPTINSFYLATDHGERLFVMKFMRGYNGAYPTFVVDGKLTDGRELCKFEVGNPDIVGRRQAESDSSVYRYDITGFDHPDAKLIAAAPELLEALQTIIGLRDVFEDLNGLLQTQVKAVFEKAEAAIAKAKGL